MENKDIIVKDFYTKNPTSRHIDLGRAFSEWIFILKMAVMPAKYKDTYKLLMQIDIFCTFQHTEASLCTYTEFEIHYPNFDRSKFYMLEQDTITELAKIAYNHSRVLFAEQSIPDFSLIKLPIKTTEEIREMIGRADIYDRLS